MMVFEMVVFAFNRPANIRNKNAPQYTGDNATLQEIKKMRKLMMKEADDVGVLPSGTNGTSNETRKQEPLPTNNIR